jgi:hypothetical protein
MNKLARIILGAEGATTSTSAAPDTGKSMLATLGENGPAASASTTKVTPRALGPIAGSPLGTPASPRPLSPLAPAGAMTTPKVKTNIGKPPKAITPPKVAADKLREMLKMPEMPKAMKPIEAPKAPKKLKDPGTIKPFTLGSTDGTI